MDIYIPNIKLPKDEPGAFQVIVMYVGADGKLRAECEGTHEVTAVPPHGRMIDADALLKKCEFVCTDDDVDVRAVRYSVVDAAPTVIPASESEERPAFLPQYELTPRSEEGEI